MKEQVGDVARFRAKESMTFYDRGTKWTNEKLDIKGTSWKAAYLPVWLYSYLQDDAKGKMLHYVAVNARTGETMGSVPINKTRLLIISAILEVIGIVLGLGWIRVFIGADDSDIWMAGLLGFTPGFLFYWMKMSRYRNMDARHTYEKETKSTINNLKQSDNLREHRKGLSNSRIAGENGNNVKGVIAKNGEKMMGQKMAEYLGIDKMIDTAPGQKIKERENNGGKQ